MHPTTFIDSLDASRPNALLSAHKTAAYNSKFEKQLKDGLVSKAMNDPVLSLRRCQSAS